MIEIAVFLPTKNATVAVDSLEMPGQSKPSKSY